MDEIYYLLYVFYGLNIFQSFPTISLRIGQVVVFNSSETNSMLWIISFATIRGQGTLLIALKQKRQNFFS